MQSLTNCCAHLLIAVIKHTQLHTTIRKSVALTLHNCYSSIHHYIKYKTNDNDDSFYPEVDACEVWQMAIISNLGVSNSP